MLLPSALLAAVAAGCNAASSTLQRKANRRVPESRPFDATLVGRVMRQPAWLLGFGAMMVSFLVQAVALRFGPLAIVEPVLAVELPLTLLFATVLLHHRPHRRDWIAAAAMALGLAAFVAALAPTGGDAGSVATPVTATAAVATVAGIAALAAAARLGPRRARAALYGAAGGAGFGLTASLLKLVVSRLDTLLVSWPTYAMAASGAASVLLVQAALHAGTLVAAQPGLTLVDPLVSLVWGIVVYHEMPRHGPVLIIAGLGALVMVAAVLALAEASARAQGHGHPAAGNHAPGSGVTPAGRGKGAVRW